MPPGWPPHGWPTPGMPPHGMPPPGMPPFGMPPGMPPGMPYMTPYGMLPSLGSYSGSYPDFAALSSQGGGYLHGFGCYSQSGTGAQEGGSSQSRQPEGEAPTTAPGKKKGGKSKVTKPDEEARDTLQPLFCPVKARDNEGKLVSCTHCHGHVEDSDGLSMR